jgi:hypothetical protein
VGYDECVSDDVGASEALSAYVLLLEYCESLAGQARGGHSHDSITDAQTPSKT